MTLRTLQRTIDRVSPTLSVRLRLLRKKLRHDMTLAVIDRFVAPGEVVVDIGAYRGVYTVALSRRLGDEGRVWAIEPFPPNVATLGRIADRRPNVRLCPGAASDHVGRQVLAVPLYRGHRLGALATLGTPPVESERTEIDLVTVDSLLGKDPNWAGKVSFIRCDVVGHEAQALAGAAGIIRRCLPAIFVEIEQRHRRDRIQDTLDWLTGFAYDGYFVKHDRLVPLSRFDVDADQLAFLDSDFVPYGMPVGYVHYFLFVPHGTDVGDLL
jgi:FkbM family methyltransferase